MLDPGSLKPDWLYSDFASDFSEPWAETTDPTNEIGEECIAHFERDDAWRMTLRGVVVTGQGSVGYIGRDRLIEMLGFAEVMRWERLAGEEYAKEMANVWPELLEDW